jgi:hypothetical protein
MPTGRPAHPPINQTLLADPQGRESILLLEKLPVHQLLEVRPPPTAMPTAFPTCPLCSLAHTKADHRCPNPTCPKGGNNNLFSTAAPPRPPAVRTVMRTTRPATGTAPPAPPRPLKMNHPHPLERRRMAWTSLKMKLARQAHARRPFPTVPTPRRPRPLYSPALRRPPPRDPAAFSRTFPEA